MRVLIQRVTQASVSIDGKQKSSIGKGLLVLASFENDDSQADIDRMVAKLAKLRVFDDEGGVMNLSVQDVGGEVLVVSQFTLHAQTKKGNRPSYIKAAKPDIAIPLYNSFVATFEKELGKPIATGEFGADMQVSLVNDGPVTIWIDSKSNE